MVPAGGSVDSVTRAMAYPMSQHIGVSIVVDNRAGGTGTIALNILRQSAPDGYTLLSAGNTIIVTGVLGKVPFDLTTALEPVVQMTSGAYVVTVNAALPVSSLKELATYAKSKPNALSYGSPGIGSIIHLGTEQLAQALGGLRIVHVPYKGNSFAIVDLLAGRIELLLAAGVANHIKSGKLKALAVTSRHRMQAFPDLPTLAEAGVQNVVLECLRPLRARGCASHRHSTLNREVTLAMNSPEVRDKISADGAEPTAPRRFGIQSVVHRPVSAVETIHKDVQHRARVTLNRPQRKNLAAVRDREASSCRGALTHGGEMVTRHRISRLLGACTAALLFAFASVGCRRGKVPQSADPRPHAVSAGGGSDILARLIGPQITDAWGQPVIVDNRPGGGGTLGAGIAARAEPDGYTLIIVSGTYGANGALYKVPYDTVNDIQPIILIGTTPLVFMVHPSLPVKTVAEFISYARANPGKLSSARRASVTSATSRASSSSSTRRSA